MSDTVEIIDIDSIQVVEIDAAPVVFEVITTGPQGGSGDDGDEGLSAYQIAVNAGFVGNEAAWLASLQGTDGTDGDDGLSAYQIAVNAGFVGNEAAWLASLHGTDGTDGDDGLSAYQIAVNAGFVGNEAAWLASLHGAAGADGSDGASGNGVSVSVDFGVSFTDKAQVVVTGQSWVTSASKITAQVMTPVGVDPDEMYLLDIKAVISDIVDGAGFTVTLYSQPEAKGVYSVMCLGV